MSTETAQEFLIERTNQRALKFSGRLIGRGSNRYWPDGTQRDYWLDVEVYESSSDGKLLYIGVLRSFDAQDPDLTPRTRHVLTAEAHDATTLLRRLSKRDRRVKNQELFVHSSIREAFEEASNVNAEFADALIRKIN